MEFDARTGVARNGKGLRDRTTEHLCGSPQTAVARVRGCNDGISAFAIHLQVFSAASRSAGMVRARRARRLEVCLKVLS